MDHFVQWITSFPPSLKLRRAGSGSLHSRLHPGFGGLAVEQWVVSLERSVIEKAMGRNFLNVVFSPATGSRIVSADPEISISTTLKMVDTINRIIRDHDSVFGDILLAITFRGLLILG